MGLAIEHRVGFNEYEYSACDPESDDACNLFF